VAVIVVADAVRSARPPSPRCPGITADEEEGRSEDEQREPQGLG
jgi:hypothetical protein